jgi:hypothetical protein
VTLQEELALVTQLVSMYERLSHLRGSRPSEGLPRVVVTPKVAEAVPGVQAPGDPRPVSERAIPNGPSIDLPLKKVPCPVGPGAEEGYRLEPDFSSPEADELIQRQLVAAFNSSNPRASELERLNFNASLASKVFETKQQISAMISGAMDAARQNPQADKIVGQVRL